MLRRLSSLILFLLFFTSSMLAAGGISWENSLDEAFTKAAREKKPLMVMVKSVHCRWCKKMLHHTLENESISKRLKKFVLVRVDKESDDARSELPEVEFVPTIFFMTAQKRVLERVTGYFNVGDFNSWIDDAEKDLK